MKKTDEIKVSAISFTTGKLLCTISDDNFTTISEVKSAIINKIPKSFEGLKIIINIHNLTVGSYNTYIVKNPNGRFLQEVKKKPIKKTIVKKNTTKKSTLQIHEYQTERGRKFRITAKNQKFADRKAVEWRDKNAKNSVIHYNFRID